MTREKYTQEQRLLLGKPRHTASLYERLDAKTSECPNTGCWWYTGTLSWGYGYIMHQGRNRRAHRVSYERHRGPIPEGLILDHLCKNKACINPDHLEVVTVRENTMRGDGPTAINDRKEVCVRGHSEWTATPGRRRCRGCAREWARRHAPETKAKRAAARALLGAP